MDDEMNKIKNKIKVVLKKVGKKTVMLFLPIIIIIVLLSSFVYYIDVWVDGKGEDDWSGTPYAAGQYTSNITINTDGSINSSMNAQELWDKMIENGSRVNLYLDSPDELLKLMNAEIITQFPDTRKREDINQDIDWDSINNINESVLQGIIKFKRKDENGNESILTYVEPYLFDAMLEDYNSTSDAETKKDLLSHFTIRENTSSTSDSSSGTNVVVTGKVADVTNAIVNEITKMDTYGLSGSVCQTWVGKAYQAAGFGYVPSGCCAYLAGTKWGVSSDFSQIVSGAAVWTGEGSYRGTQCKRHKNGGCGHAGIYYKDDKGNDWVIHFYNKSVHKDTLEHWLEYYGQGNTPVWGWQGGINVVEDEGDVSTSTTETTSDSETETAVKAAKANGYYVEVATWNSIEETVVSDDPKVDTTPNNIYTMTTKQINYQDLVSDYVMPFDYLWSMLVITEDKDFVMDLADLVYNSKIEITVYDNLTTNTNTEVNKYTRNKNVFTNASVYVKYFKASTDSILNTKTNSGTNWDYDVKVGDYTTTHTTITKTNTINVAVTYADVWMAKYQQTYTNQKKSNDSGGTTETLENIDYPAEYDERVEGNSKNSYAKTLISNTKDKVYDENEFAIIYNTGISSVIEEIYYATVNRTKTVSNVVETNTYIASQMLVEEKTDKNSQEPNFVTIFLDPNNSKAKNNILSVESWLFELLEINDSTKGLLDLTKYLLYKATGTDYGVTEFDFGVFKLKNFKAIDSSQSGVDLIKEYIHFWEHSSPPPRNADGTCYIIEDDGAGNPTVGYGVDIFNGGFAEEFRQAGYPTTMGGEVPVEFVDALEEREIQECLNSVKSLTSGINLTGYQIAALVSRAYNCGVGGAITTNRGSASKNFVDSYNAYWNESDDQFESKNSNANFSHALYTNYMSKPVTAKGKFLLGLERRRKSEWVLFQTGYFDVLDKWYSEGNGGTIIECAKTIHEYMETNGYTYCVYGGNSYEECGSYGKSHGLSRTFEESKSNKNTCCATYVSWVLQEVGYLTESEHNDGANNLTNLLISKGWTMITDSNQFQPGDVLSYNNHVEIYAGDGTVYNAGSGKAIRSASPQTKNISKAIALRAPN